MSQQILFGVSGWDYRDWAGPLYPEPRPRSFRALPLLASFLDFMEVNVTFYRPVAAAVAERWLEETPPRFQFVVKAWRGWSHDGQNPSGNELHAFRKVIDPMLESGRLLGVLLQLPPSAVDEPRWREQLDAVAAALQPAQLFFEPRHESWLHRDLLEWLEERQVGYVNVDLPTVRRLPRLTSINTTHQGFLRLHGRRTTAWSGRATRDERYDYHYPPAQLEQLASTTRRLSERVPQVLVAANNHFRAQAVAAAVALKGMLLGDAEAPQRLLESYPELRQLARPLDTGAGDRLGT